MKRTALLLCVASTALGMLSPFFAGVFANGPLHAWFHLLPTVVDQWLWPEGDVLMLAVAMLVFFLQYLALFTVAAGTPPLIRLALNCRLSPALISAREPEREPPA
jgi:hypothetical protein